MTWLKKLRGLRYSFLLTCICVVQSLYNPLQSTYFKTLRQKIKMKIYNYIVLWVKLRYRKRESPPDITTTTNYIKSVSVVKI